MTARVSIDARPILKWAGGKRRLVGEIAPHLPETIETYYEPFVGGAAVFFALANASRFRRAVLSDRNADLVEVYRAVQKNVGKVVRVLESYEHDEDFYYELRDREPDTLDLYQRAARLIYLNKTGYNGLYRVNKSGRFNVPFGRYKNPNFCDEPGLRAAARALASVEISVADFEEACSSATKRDAVYFDPPYVPVSKTANFTAYDKEDFGLEQHERLAKVFGKLARKGVAVVLSNSDTRETRDLYRDFDVQLVDVTRPINSDPERRGAVSELLVVGRRRR